MEIFKSIKDFSNYQVSNLGRVKNIKTNKFLKYYSSRGYLKVDLVSDLNKKTKLFIHRLVLICFVKDEPNLTVHHINHVRNDNRLENLQWMTREQNSSVEMKSKIKNKRYKEKIKDLFNSKSFNSAKEFYEELLKL